MCVFCRLESYCKPTHTHSLTHTHTVEVELAFGATQLDATCLPIARIYLIGAWVSAHTLFSPSLRAMPALITVMIHAGRPTEPGSWRSVVSLFLGLHFSLTNRTDEVNDVHRGVLLPLNGSPSGVLPLLLGSEQTTGCSAGKAAALVSTPVSQHFYPAVGVFMAMTVWNSQKLPNCCYMSVSHKAV